MPAVEVFRYTTASNDERDALLQTARSFTQAATGPSHFYIGRPVSDDTIIFLIVEWDGDSNHKTSSKTDTSDAFQSKLNATLGKPASTLQFNLAPGKSLFGPKGALNSHITEMAHNWFASSFITPAFQQRIETDIKDFDNIFRTEALGGENWLAAWDTSVNLNNNSNDNNEAVSFVLFRAYADMTQFEKSTQTEAFQKAIPILISWGRDYNAGHKMWHLQNELSTTKG